MQKYSFTWWGWLYVWLFRIVLISASVILFLLVIFSLSLQQPPCGAILGLPLQALIVYLFVYWFNLPTEVIVRDSGLEVQVFWWWVRIPFALLM